MAIKFNSNNWDEIFQLMDEHGNSEFPFFGETEEGEDISITIFPDRVVTSISQSNGWVRTNIYHRDYTVEETFSR